MSNRNFDASFFTKRLRDLNVAQQLYTAIQTGQRVGNPITALNEVSLVNQYRPGVQTIFQRGTVVSESSIDIGGIANLLVPESISRRPRRVLPSRVIILGIDPEDRQLTIRFSPPTENASSIKNYKYSTDNGLTFRTLTPPQISSPINIYGLLNGSNYDVILTPISDDGDGESTVAVRATPYTFPSKPTSLVASPGNASANINFVAGNPNGSNITKYQYSFNDNDFFDITPIGNSINISGLTNGNNTTVYLRAVNARGPGSSESISFIPSTIPDPPSFSTVTTGDRSISVNFNDGNNGGNSIFEYQYSTDGINYTTITTRSFNLSGLTNGSPVSVYVKARNANGYSNPVVASYTPATIPSAPSFSLVNTDNGSISINFTGSGSDGGSPITSYQYSTDGIIYSPIPNTTDRSFTISGLTNGTNYTVRLKAVNAKGDSSIVTTTATPATVPDAPSFSTISTSSGSVTVNFTDGFNGGSNILDYEYSTDGTTFTTILSRSFTLTGLTDGTPVPIYVRARNSRGRGTTATTNATPSTIPSAPSSLLAGTSNGLLTISVTDGANGGSAITGYKYRLSPTYATEYSSSSNPFTISGLTNGTSYTVRVYAVNANGTSSTYTTVTATPSTIPNAPTSLATSVGNGTITVTVTAGANGGSAITGYTYYLSTDGYVTSYVTSSSPFTITGLTNSTSYTIQVYAMNVNGNSSTYTEISATPVALPSPPTGLSTIRGMNKITLSFTPGSDNGSPITNYQYSTDNGVTFRAFSPAITSGPVDITTLSTNGTTNLSTNGTIYTILLKAVNIYGVSNASNAITGSTLTLNRMTYTVGITTSWTAPSNIINPVEYLVVGAGGSGGAAYDGRGGGGGGAGAVITGTMNVIANTTYTVKVASETIVTGTQSYTSIGTTGQSSQFANIVALGGGGGAGSHNTTYVDGLGGSMATSNTGSNGGNGSFRWSGTQTYGTGGGGGGSSSNGSNGRQSFPYFGGSGGNGTVSSISGSTVTYGSGGSGGGNYYTTYGSSGSNNRGDGGDGGSAERFNYTVQNGGNGGSGIVILKYYT